MGERKPLPERNDAFLLQVGNESRSTEFRDAFISPSSLFNFHFSLFSTFFGRLMNVSSLFTLLFNFDISILFAIVTCKLKKKWNFPLFS